LKSVTFTPTSTVTSIGNGAFQGCSALTSITIPNSVTSIGAAAFNGCTALTSVTISNSVTSIPAAAFYQCSALKSVTFTPTSTVTSIDGGAFQGCALTSITIPNSVTSIGGEAFLRCPLLATVTIKDGQVGITSPRPGVAFFGATNVTTVDNSVTLLVYNNSSQGTTSFLWGGFTFVNTYTLDGNYYYAATITSIPSYVPGYTNLIQVIIGNVVTSFGDSAFFSSSGLTSITIPNSVISIGIGAFIACTGLTSIIIPNSVTSIGENAFLDCSALTTVTIKDGQLGKTSPYSGVAFFGITVNTILPIDF
jgi:hypothetical protein